jgi:hypothetical protein
LLFTPHAVLGAESAGHRNLSLDKRVKRMLKIFRDRSRVPNQTDAARFQVFFELLIAQEFF